MYTAEVLIKKDSGRINKDDCYVIQGLPAEWQLNGQICSYELLAAEGNECRLFVRLPERCSLSPRFANRGVREALQKIADQELSKPAVRIIGRDPWEAQAAQPGRFRWLILSADCIDDESPLWSGETFSNVPLYRIPCTSEDGTYRSILSWQTLYKSCDQLWLESSVGERFGYTQMSRLDSDLSKMGRNLCKLIEQKSGLPTYYHLHRLTQRTAKIEMERRCPGCDGKWLLERRLLDRFDFRCENCRLVSEIPFGIRYKLGG